jgi:hypothetical protein
LFFNSRGGIAAGRPFIWGRRFLPRIPMVGQKRHGVVPWAHVGCLGNGYLGRTINPSFQLNHGTHKTIALFSALALIGLSACQKEGTLLPANDGIAGVDVTPRVKAFVELAAHHSPQRDGATMTADSAVWYLEAGINYSDAQIWAAHTETSTDTLALPFDFSSGTVSEATLFDAYAQLRQAVSPLTTGAQTLLLVDVVETPDVLSSGHLLAICQIGSGGERSYNNPPNTSYPSGYSCSWDNSQQPSMPCNQLSADQVIQGKINFANILQYIPGQYAYSVETWSVSHIPTDISAKNFYWKDSFIASSTPNNNGVHETLFFSAKMTSPATYPCLDNVEMAYWTGNATTNGTWMGITKIRQTYCPSKIFFTCTLNGAVLGWNGTTYGIHAAQMQFGLLAGGRTH